MMAYSTRTGLCIKGTFDMVPGVAQIDDDSWKLTDGKLDFEYGGETKMDWNRQTTQTERALDVDGCPTLLRIFVDEDGNHVLEDDIELREEMVNGDVLRRVVASGNRVSGSTL